MITRLLAFAAVHAYIYLAFAFIGAEWNPLDWDSELRGLCVFLGTVFGVIVATFPGLTKE